MFTERLNQICKTLQASNIDIAACAGCDRSNISRLRNGARVPKPTGVAAERLALGLCKWAEQNNATGLLCSCIGADPETPEEQLPTKLLTWLYQDMDFPLRARHKEEDVNARFFSFGKRLGESMDLCGLSSIRLSVLTGVDASRISRFRNGTRRPKRNSQPLADIARTILLRFRQEGRTGALTALTGIPEEMLLQEDLQPATEAFRAWLLTGETEV